MPLDLPANLITAKNLLHTSSAWLKCVKIEFSDGSIERLVRNTEDICIGNDTDYSEMDCLTHWRLDETSGTIIVDNGDLKLDGTAQRNTSLTMTGGKVDVAQDLDGANDYITISSVAGLSGLAALTIPLWFKTSDSGTQCLIAKDNYGISDVTREWFIDMYDSGKIRFYLMTNEWSHRIGIKTIDRFDDGLWHYLIATWDGTFDTGGMAIYIDGRKVDVTVDKAGSFNGLTSHTGTPVRIGVYPVDSYAYKFDGIIDDVRIYDRVIGEKERQYLYNSGVGTELVPIKYTAFPIQIDRIEQSNSGEIPQLRVQIGNITRLLQSYLDELDGGRGSIVTLTYVNSGLLYEDYSALTFEYELVKTIATEDWITCILGASNPLTRRFPLNRYFARSCRWLFRDANNLVSTECGYVGKTINNITISSNEYVKVQANGHGFVTGDVVYFAEVGGTVELNGNHYSIHVQDSNTFTLDDTDGADFSAYTSGGIVGYYECSRTLSDCVARGQDIRFGGFWGLIPGGVQIA